MVPPRESGGRGTSELARQQAIRSPAGDSVVFHHNLYQLSPQEEAVTVFAPPGVFELRSIEFAPIASATALRIDRLSSFSDWKIAASTVLSRRFSTPCWNGTTNPILLVSVTSVISAACYNIHRIFTTS